VRGTCILFGLTRSPAAAAATVSNGPFSLNDERLSNELVGMEGMMVKEIRCESNEKSH